MPWLLIDRDTVARTNAVAGLCLHVSNAVIGRIVVFVTPNALRIDIERSKCHIIANAPTWRVVLFNDSQTKGLEMSFLQWKKHTPRWAFITMDDWPRHEVILLSGATERFHLACDRYVLAESLDGRLVQKTKGAMGEYVVARPSQTIVPKEACQILERLFNVPEVDGLPVSMVTMRSRDTNDRLDRDGDHQLQTLTLEHQGLDPEMFSYPAKFEKVRREADVDANSINNNETVKDLLF